MVDGGSRLWGVMLLTHTDLYFVGKDLSAEPEVPNQTQLLLSCVTLRMSGALGF